MRYRPAPGGVSIGHYNVTAGTLGCIVEDYNGYIYILSNNHVLANSNNASVNDPIYQPGPHDGGSHKDIIGRLSRWITLDLRGINYVDAAIAAPLNRNYVDPNILGIGRVMGVARPKLEEYVVKSGRTTGVTRGYISTINSFVKVDYGSLGVLYFDDQIIIRPGNFSRGGDSGSLVLNTDRYAVGLLFAGSDSHTVANPINAVINAMRLKRIV